MATWLKCVVLLALIANCWCLVQVPVATVPYNPQPPPYGFVVFLNNTQNNTEPFDPNGCKSNAINTTLSHHMFLGCVKRTDKLLFVQQFIKPPRFWAARKKIVDFPGPQQPGVLPPIISGVRVYDNYYDGKGGYCNVISGGINYRHVSLQLYSKSPGRGINFTVKIYGH